MRFLTDTTRHRTSPSLALALLLVVGLLLAGASLAAAATGEAAIIETTAAAGAAQTAAPAAVSLELPASLDSLPAMAAIGLVALALTIALRISR